MNEISKLSYDMRNSDKKLAAMVIMRHFDRFKTINNRQEIIKLQKDNKQIAAELN